MSSFPIDPHLNEIADAMRSEQFVLLKAEPGAGKTTRVPQFLLKSFRKILVVQPRRLAARLAAEWVAEQSGEPLGQTVGFQIRLENKVSERTRLLFVTEGVLTRKLLNDRFLTEFDCVILDEFHERHIHSDIALALLKKICFHRKDLHVLIMSATLELGPLNSYLGQCRVFQVPGRTFPVAIDHLPIPTDASLEELVFDAVLKMFEDVRCGGNILVFLSGIAEITSCADRLSQYSLQKFEVIPLSAELANNHKKIYQNPDKIKIILATNVAETSLTLPNIRGVVDSGRAKVSGFAPWSGLPTIRLERVSQASCIQRAGRAGRIAPGVCYRLFTASDFHSRPVYTEPEIRRIDLCQTLLELQAMSPDVAQAWVKVDWLEAPSPEIVEKNFMLLSNLGAFDSKGLLSELGKAMANLPLHPRLGRLVLTAQAMGGGGFGLLAAILINEGFLVNGNEAAREDGDCDVCNQLQFILGHKKGSGNWDRVKGQRCQQLYESFRKPLRLPALHSLGTLDENVIRKSIFFAFADRVAKYRPLAEEHNKRRRSYNFALGRGGYLNDSSVVRKHEWIVVIEAKEALDDESGLRGRIQWASAIDPIWLGEDPFGLRSENYDIRLDQKSGKVRKIISINYGKLLIQERQELADANELEQTLLRTVREKWSQTFADSAALVSYHAKLSLLDRYEIPHKMPKFSGDYLDLLISHLCEGASSLAEIEAKDLKTEIDAQLDYEDLQLLDQHCPDTIRLSNGRQLKVHYETEGEAWVEAKIQDFFGQAETPSLCRGRHPLLLKLLAPSRRPAQLTRDLAGFWAGSYFEVRKELKRRYPKHPWPDDPAREKPPEPRGPHRS